MRGSLRPLSVEPASALRLGRLAIGARTESAAWAQAYAERLEAGSIVGRLYVVDGVATGFVSWSGDGPVGASVDLLYAAPRDPAPPEYGAILSAVGEEAGPVAFVAGPLAGLSPAEEERLMRSLGFRRYGRSEMVLDTDDRLREPGSAPGERLRPVELSDLPALARLHEEAYRNTFDRYLFLELTDEREDALREVREIANGRWGEFYLEGSWIAEHDGEPVGAVLSVRGQAGALIADVMVSPGARGRGVGRRVLTAAVRSMRSNGGLRIYLNVTEGNEPALRLYRGLGFVRSIGPTRDWYNSARIPVPPFPGA